MTLSFKQKFENDHPTYFPDKILMGLATKRMITQCLYVEYMEKLPNPSPHPVAGKLHTIRTDKSDQWKAGNKIHLVINNRTLQRLQFAPTIYCVSTQKIVFYWMRYPTKSECFVFIDDVHVGIFTERPDMATATGGLNQLAINDGFASVLEFFKYFHTDYVGKIIHWTDCHYNTQTVLYPVNKKRYLIPKKL